MVVGLFLKGIKTYKNITFIPIEKSSFVAYIGRNGIGKSSILEGLNCFFNNKSYPVHKDVGQQDKPYVVPLFLIQKTKLEEAIDKEKDRDKIIGQFNELSDFFWTLDQKDLAQGSINVSPEFFALRERLIAHKDEYYFFALGETSSGKPSIGTFQSHEYWKVESNKDGLPSLLQSVKELYSYIYIPAESDVENFTKLETEEMQKIIGKKLRDEISKILLSSAQLSKINSALHSFVDRIKETLNDEYEYKTGYARNNSLVANDLINKVLEAYFQKRILFKKNFKARELSSGEKKKAFIDVVYAFLGDKEDKRDRFTILAIDEPESSLHISACFEQFEKLYKISEQEDIQIFLTTHWYGFLPIVSHGYGHFLRKDQHATNAIKFESYDLYHYRSQIKTAKATKENKIPYDTHLKSINDLVQSIFYSLHAENAYSWLLVEGISDKIYCEYFFKDLIKNHRLRILPLGGKAEVKKLFEHLSLPLKDIKKERAIIGGKVVCLIDTDNECFGEDIKQDQLKETLWFVRFNDRDSVVRLINIEAKELRSASIENALNPLIFKETMQILNPELELDIQDEAANTTSENMRSFELDKYFREKNGENKVIFAQKYVEIVKERGLNRDEQWVKDIETFFKKS